MRSDSRGELGEGGQEEKTPHPNPLPAEPGRGDKKWETATAR